MGIMNIAVGYCVRTNNNDRSKRHGASQQVNNACKVNLRKIDLEKEAYVEGVIPI
jgi:hypothetical protein